MNNPTEVTRRRQFRPVPPAGVELVDAGEGHGHDIGRDVRLAVHAHHGVLDAHRQRRHGDDHGAGEIVRVGLGDPGQRGCRDDNDQFDGKADPPLLQLLRPAQQASSH